MELPNYHQNQVWLEKSWNISLSKQPTFGTLSRPGLMSQELHLLSLWWMLHREGGPRDSGGGVSRPREVFQEVGNHMIFGVIKAVTLGGGNSNIFYFPLYTWGNDPIWRVFFKWVGSTTNSCWTLGVDGGSHSDGTRSFTIQCPEGWCWLSKRPSSFIQTRPLIHSFG